MEVNNMKKFLKKNFAEIFCFSLLFIAGLSVPTAILIIGIYREDIIWCIVFSILLGLPIIFQFIAWFLDFVESYKKNYKNKKTTEEQI